MTQEISTAAIAEGGAMLAPPCAMVIFGAAGGSQVPAARVQPVGEIFWFVDRAAAGGS